MITGIDTRTKLVLTRTHSDAGHIQHRVVFQCSVAPYIEKNNQNGFVSGHKTNFLYVLSEHIPNLCLFRCQTLIFALYFGYFSAPWCMLWHFYYRKQIKSTF